MTLMSKSGIDPMNLLAVAVTAAIVGIVAVTAIPVPVAAGIAIAVSMLLVPTSGEPPKIKFSFNIRAIWRAALAGGGATAGIYIVDMFFVR